MDKTQIVILAVAFAVVAIRLYQKYIKKDKNKSGSNTPDTSMPSSPKDDDYEPYSKK